MRQKKKLKTSWLYDGGEHEVKWSVLTLSLYIYMLLFDNNIMIKLLALGCKWSHFGFTWVLIYKDSLGDKFLLIFSQDV